MVGFCSTSLYLRKITDTEKPCIEDFQTDWWFCYFLYDLCQYPATLVLGILYSMVIIHVKLCLGLIEKKSGFLTPWLFVSFIAIIGIAVNFGYVSWFTDFIFVKNTVKSQAVDCSIIRF